MRLFRFHLLAYAAFVTACQSVTPEDGGKKSLNQQLTTKNAALLSSATQLPSISPAPPKQPATPAPTTPSVPIEASSLDNFDQNSSQTGVDLTINAINSGVNPQTSALQTSPSVTSQALVISKTFDPAEIIGFATSMLFHDLGEANMIRQEGPVEVWQYQFVSCVVDFFFYPSDKEGSPMIAKSWDMRSQIMGDFLDRRSCRDEMNLYHRKILSNS